MLLAGTAENWYKEDTMRSSDSGLWGKQKFRNEHRRSKLRCSAVLMGLVLLAGSLYGWNYHSETQHEIGLLLKKQKELVAMNARLKKQNSMLERENAELREKQIVTHSTEPPRSEPSRKELAALQMFPSQHKKEFGKRDMSRGRGEKADSTGVDGNAPEKNGKTLFWNAVWDGDVAAVQQLLSIPGIDVNAVDNAGFAPLFVAAQNGHAMVVKVLLADPRVDVCQTSQSGASPLYIAAQNGHEEVVKLLVCDTRMNVNQVIDNGCAALHVAAQNGGGTVAHCTRN